MYGERRDEAVQKHSMKNRVVRWWLEFRGWKAPYVPSRGEIIQDMAARCTDLSDWMRRNSTRPFYSGSDMSVYIDKPAAVAERLTAA